MVEYITRPRLQSMTGSLAESATIIRKAESQTLDGATFLSHATKDANLLPSVIKLLEDHGAKVYIDKKDSDLPPYTNQETANQLRTNLTKSNNFVLFTTEKSKDSRWMPWELGLADGHKGSSRIAILPGVESNSDTGWAEQEYLGIYERIVYGSFRGQSERMYMVLNQKAKIATPLRQWLRK